MRKIPNEELNRPTEQEYAEMEKMPVVVVLDSVRSLNNVGSFFRTSDAFSVEKIILCGITGTPPNREIHKTALGAENTVVWEAGGETLDALNKLAGQGYELIAIEQVENAVMLNEFACDANHKYALVFGNEVFGVEQEVVSRCDKAIEIPQFGTKHSLNVSVCAGVVLWHFYSQIILSSKE